MAKFNPATLIFTERYRPNNVDSIVGDFRDKIKSYLKSPMAIPNFLFYSKTPGTGKCLGKDTPIIMFDGTIKKVQDIKEGELLMGPDSKPRIIKGVISGRDELYKIKQKYGDDYVVNKDHILSLKSSHKKNIINICIKDYTDSSDAKKADLKGYKVGVEFNEAIISIDPYFLGLWLGDGCEKSQRIHNPDKEIKEYLEQYAFSFGYKLHNHCGNKDKCPSLCITKGKNGGEKNKIRELLKNYNLMKNKHIPNEYLYN
jgi:replicative DNA helicase